MYTRPTNAPPSRRPVSPFPHIIKGSHISDSSALKSDTLLRTKNNENTSPHAAGKSHILSNGNETLAYTRRLSHILSYGKYYLMFVFCNTSA